MPPADVSPPACSRCDSPCPVREPDERDLWAEYWGLLVCPRCLTRTEIAALAGRALADSTSASGVAAPGAADDRPGGDEPAGRLGLTAGP